MNVWKLTAPEKLSRESELTPEPQEGELKVRVTDVLLSTIDACLFNGAVKAPYPIVPGRFAIGRIMNEDGPESLKKGTRVVLHTFPQPEDTGTEKLDFSADGMRIRGQTENGFLRDFVCVRESDVTAVPESLSDEAALVTELVALAKAALDTLNVQKGQHIAVIGGDMLGIIVCRLLIYQQISPILIDNHTDRLEFAKQNGVYYTSYADDSLIDRIAQITGGRLADGAIFVTTSGLQDKSFPFRVSARGTNTVFCGFHAGDLMVNLDLAFRKQIAVYGVADTEDYLPTAVNLLANKAVDLSAFRIRRAPASKAASVIAEIAENPAEREVDTLDILELL